jgi:hypothetical protein
LAPASFPALRLVWIWLTNWANVGDDAAGGRVVVVGAVVDVVDDDVVVVVAALGAVVVVVDVVVDVVDVVDDVVVLAAVVDVEVVVGAVDVCPFWRPKIKIPPAIRANTTTMLAATIAVRLVVKPSPWWFAWWLAPR